MKIFLTANEFVITFCQEQISLKKEVKIKCTIKTICKILFNLILINNHYGLKIKDLSSCIVDFVVFDL